MPIASSDLVETEALLREANSPAFAEPWMAHAFACTVQLSRQGIFTWSEWVEAFSAEIEVHPAQSDEPQMLPTTVSGWRLSRPSLA